MKAWRLLPLAGLFLALPVPSSAQVPPDKALATFTVSEGLELSLFASEPLFVNPTCMDIDHKGRVWVCESVNYRNRLRGQKKLNRAEGDRIVILEDSKGDGKADKATTFYQAPTMLAPLGIAVAKNPVGPGYKVFVCQSPDILVFEDKDGDGKADGPPTKLLSGFGGFDHDHGVHGILIGPDMKLYFSVGDTGVHGLQSSDGKGRKWESNKTDCRAGTIWRCDMDGKNLELLAHNFRNEYEPCVDSFGTIFVSDNDDDGNQQTRICYVMPGGNYGYHPRGPGQTHWHEEQPGVVPKILRTHFGSPTGMCVYEGTLLPEKYRGQLLHTDAGPRHLRCYHLKPQGAGYDVEREDMVTSTDSWFRPSDVCVAPDGSVFIADWYDPGVGGHGMGDTTRGRIYRLTPKGHKGYTVPKFDVESKAGLIEALGSPNLAARYIAMAKFDGMNPADAWAVLKPIVSDVQPKNPVLRARAMWRFAEDKRMSWPSDPRVEKAYMESLLMISLPLPDASSFDLLQERIHNGPSRLLGDAFTPARGREALLNLRNLQPHEVKKYLYPLAEKYDGKDRFYLEAIGTAVGHHDEERRKIILADFDKHFPEWNEKVADLVWELRPPSTLANLAGRLADAKISAASRARIVDILATGEAPQDGKSLLSVFKMDVPEEVRARVIENLKLFLPGKWQALRKTTELEETIRTLLAKPQSRVTALRLIGAAEKIEFLADITTLTSDQDAAVRSAAIQALAALPTAEATGVLHNLIQSPPAGQLSEVAKALGSMAQQRADRKSTGAAIKVLQDVLLDSKETSLRQAALDALAGTRSGTAWLLDLQAKGQLTDDLKPEAARLLRNSPHMDLRNRAMIAFPPPARLDPKKLPSLTQLARRKGDAEHGKQILFASFKNDMQCMKCHKVNGQGGQIGPDLSVIGKKASRENLFESILYPSKAIADQFVTWQIETTKGQLLAGLVIEETADSVTLRDANGKDYKIAKKEIEARIKSPKSLMPEDLLAYMTEAELIDVVEYLFSLK